MATADPLPQVILVHGTGASDVAIRGEKWWQLDSAFGKQLSQKINGKAEIVDPFRWSGENSEYERRAAGKALLARLRMLDAKNVKYHLVGHSHGGSVIWHALHLSARSTSTLKGLKSWTTVGTPFLNFQPTPPIIWNYLLLAILSLIIGWAFFWRASPEEWLPVVRGYLLNGQSWQPALLLVSSVGLLVLLWVIAAYRVLAPLLSVMRHAVWFSFANMRARNTYGALWLGLWHPLDEPINGLAATLGKPPQIAPRVSADSRWALLPVVGWLMRLLNWVPARAADEFAWLQISRKLQGADIPNLSLTTVSRAPKPLEPGFSSLPQNVAEEMSASADAKAAEVVGRLRAILEAAYDVQDSEVVFKRIGGTLTFQEIVHTSYFDFAYITHAVARQISASGSAADEPPLPTRLSSFVRQTAKPSAYLNYAFMRTIVFFGLATVFSTAAALSVYDNVVAPQTDRFILDRITQVFNDGAKSNVGRKASVAQVAVRLARLGIISDPEAKLNELADKRSLVCSPYVLAEYFGSIGEFDRVRSSLARIEEIESQAPDDRGTKCEEKNPPLPQLRLLAVLAAPPKDAISEPQTQVLNALFDQVSADLRSEWHIDMPERAEKLAYLMAEHGRDDLAKSIIEAESSIAEADLRHALCSFIRLADRLSQSEARVAEASRSRDACTRSTPVPQQSKAPDDAEIANFKREPLLTRLRVVLQNNVEPALLDVTPEAVLSELDTVLTKAFSSAAAPTSFAQRRERAQSRVDLSRILIFAARHMDVSYQEGVNAKFLLLKDKASVADSFADSMMDVALNIVRYDKNVLRSPVIGGFVTSSLEPDIERHFSRSIAIAQRLTFGKRALQDTTVLASSLMGPEKFRTIIDRKVQEYLEEKDVTNSIKNLMLVAGIVEQDSKDSPDGGRERVSRIVKKMIEKVRFDEQSWRDTDGIYVGSSIEVVKFARNLPSGIRKQLIDDAERGLHYVLDSEQLSNYISELVKLRTEARDLERARNLAERAFDADTVMRSYAAILDQIIVGRMQKGAVRGAVGFQLLGQAASRT